MWARAGPPAGPAPYAVPYAAPRMLVAPGVIRHSASCATLRDTASSIAHKNVPVMRALSASSFCSTHSSDEDSCLLNELLLAQTSHGPSQASQPSPQAQWSPSGRETEASLLQRACRVYEAVKQRLAESRRQVREMRTECQVLAQSANQLHRDHQQAQEHFFSTARWHFKRGHGSLGTTRTPACRAARRQRSAPPTPVDDRPAVCPGGAPESNSASSHFEVPVCRARSASMDRAGVGVPPGSAPCAPVSLRVAPWQGKWRLAAELPASQASMDAVPPPVVPKRFSRGDATKAAFAVYGSLPVAPPPADANTATHVFSSLQKGHHWSSPHAELRGNIRQSMLPAVPPQELTQPSQAMPATPGKKESFEAKGDASQSTLEACSTVCGTASPATPPSISGTETTSPSRPSQTASSQSASSRPGSRLPPAAVHSQLPPPPLQTKSGAVHFVKQPAAPQMRQAEDEFDSASLTLSELRKLKKQLQELEQEAAAKLQNGQASEFCANSARGSSNRSVASGVSTRRGSDASGVQVQSGGEQCGGSACSSDNSEVQDAEAPAGNVDAALRRPERRQKTAKIANQNLEKIFTHCDRDGDGNVNKRDLIKVCKESDEVADFLQLPRQIRQEDEARVKMEHLFQAADQDNDRKITWEEFRAFYLSGAEQRLQDMFKLLDRNGDGRVEPEELIKVCQRHEEVQDFFGKRHELVGRDLEDWEVVANDLCKDAGSGSISWEAFRSFYMKRKSVLAEAPHAEKLPAKCRSYTVDARELGT